MHRIDTSTAQKEKFGAGKNGFTEGDPRTGVKATALNASFCDSLQEELCNFIEKAGLTLDNNENTQLWQAVAVLLGKYLATENRLSEIKTDGTEAQTEARENIGCGTAATHAAEDFLPGNYTAPVTSVNEKTGAVELGPDDIGALPSNGNAVSATRLQTPRNIANHPFDGTADIAISAGDVGAYGTAESDARYVADMQLGAETLHSIGGAAVDFNPTGTVLTGFKNDSNNDDLDELYSKPLQKYVNGAWVVISG